MNNYIPKMYKKSIFDINYSKLKAQNIKCLIFDLDNTLALIDDEKLTEKTIEFLKELKINYKIVIISNNTNKRLSSICVPLDVDYISFALKPFSYSFKKIRKKYNLQKNEMCIIGDQLVTDILGGNAYGIWTILVDPLGEKDLKITSINRIIERIKLKKFKKMHLLERGKYYE